jgi:hypothetical membrane protein
MARISVAFATLTLIFLAALHVISPEYDPSWRMVSEYAHGHYSWVLSLMFLCWGLGTWALALAISKYLKSATGKTGLAFLVIAGIGEVMAAIYDIDHPLHDVAGLLGVLGLPVAAILISIKIYRDTEWRTSKKLLLWLANLTWFSVVLLIGSMIFMYISFTKAGGKITGHLTALPPGVIGLDGWADRLLIIIYYLWAIEAARQIIANAKLMANQV